MRGTLQVKDDIRSDFWGCDADRVLTTVRTTTKRGLGRCTCASPTTSAKQPKRHVHPDDNQNQASPLDTSLQPFQDTTYDTDIISRLPRLSEPCSYIEGAARGAKAAGRGSCLGRATVRHMH